MSNPCNIDLTDEQAECYLDRYVDLKDAFGDDLKKAKQHWKRYGCIPKEGRSYECLPAKCKSSVSDKQAICYLDRYAETGDQYVEVLQKIIEQNDLKDFDDAKLLPSSVELESLI